MIALANEVWAGVELRRPPDAPAAPAANPVEPQPVAVAPSAAVAQPPPRALAFVPLGVGWFARGSVVAGAAWAIVELGLFVASAVTTVQLNGMKMGENRGPFHGEYLEPEIPKANMLNVVTSVTFFAGLAAVAADVLFGNSSWPE
jgi:hypothetical protein